MNRTDRLVAIVMYLQGRRVVKADELARHFEVTVRTIYRDIAALGEGGVPITGEAGVGYTLVKSYHLPPVMLDADEAAALFVSGEIAKRFSDASLQRPLGTALDKLRAVLPRDRQDHVDRFSRHTVVMERACGHSDPQAQPVLMPVQRAVMQRQVLRLRYHGIARDSETLRDTEPLGLVFHSGSWYLVARCRLRQDFRHFRVDRIRGMEELPERFSPPDDFSLARHLEESMGKTDTIPARIWFAKEAQPRARRESYATLVPEEVYGGGAAFLVYTHSLDWLASWVVSFGNDAEALAPDELREKVREKVVGLISRYRLEAADVVA